jgi:UDP:flavonoid glycosyltransferase YjiC (YdhE family)
VSRVFLAWELGSNLGHLSRLLPLGLRLKERGHDVMVAARDVGLATEVLAPAGIRFVQSPGITGKRHGRVQPVSLADLMLMQGWESPTVLWGLVQAWGNVLRLFRSSVAVLDYAPTALLTARILGLHCALLGTGFELPPLETPLPMFPGCAGITEKTAATADAQALESANFVLDAYGAPRLEALRDLFRTEARWLTTFAELDQYGPRSGETYVGPIGSLDRGESVQWPEGFAHRVLAYLRPETPALSEILRALAAQCEAAVICAAPGVPPDSVKSLERPGFQFFCKVVSLSALLPQTSLFLSYGPAASVSESLLSGVPQLMIPAHVEAQMTAIRVQCTGAGVALRGSASEAEISAALQRLLHDPRYKACALEFASRYRGFDRAAAADRIVSAVERFAERDASKVSAARRTG